MSQPNHILVVGAGLGAQSTIEQLRKDGYGGEITLLSAEQYEPYDRPPLSKDELWAEEAPAPRLLGHQKSLADLGVTFRPGVTATGLDVVARVVHTDAGESVAFDTLVIATGSVPRMLDPLAHELEGVFVLRTFDEAISLRKALDKNPRLVVVGGGFIGCEVAGGAAQAGIDVTVIEPLVVPLARSMGPTVGNRVANRLTDAGVKLLTGIGVSAITGTDGVVDTVHLTDGTNLPADAVLVALGANPVVDWLRDSGLELGRGIITTEHGETSAPGIFAVGDVAEAYSDRRGKHVVTEHWMNARDQGALVAAKIMNKPEDQVPAASLPYFWSEQLGTRIQALGFTDAEAETHTVEWTEPKPGAIVLYGDADRVTAAVGFGAAARLMRLRPLIERYATRAEFEASILGTLPVRA